MRRCGPREFTVGASGDDRNRWRVIAATLVLAAIATVADVTGDYEVPAEFYPFAGIVIGAALARIGGSKEVADRDDPNS